nr:coat protein [Nodaviridae sp.]
MNRTTISIPNQGNDKPKPQRKARRPKTAATKPRKQRRSRRRRGANMKMGDMMRMSPAGLAFLKCAFASPDFNTDPGLGIPDKFQGKVLSRKDVLTSSLSFAAGRDTFLVVLPIPGMAVFSADVPIGTFPIAGTTFNGSAFPGFSTLFGTTSDLRSANVTAFRYSSMNAGLYPTSNQMQFAGSITVWKAPIRLASNVYSLTIPTTAPLTTSQYVQALTGLESIQAVGPENVAHSFIDGVYTTSTCNEPEFEFSDIIEGVQSLPPAGVTGPQSGQPFTIDAGAAGTGGITGLGNMDAIIIRVSTPTGAVNAAVLKVWACLEYRPNPSSLLYQYGHDSPPLDELAMRQYRDVARRLPLAVIAKENAKFWEMVQRILRGTLSIARNVPGPIGVGAGLLTQLQDLFI